MPSPADMLFAYQAMVRASAGSGLAHLNNQAKYGTAIRALLEMVNADYRQRLGDKPCP